MKTTFMGLLGVLCILVFNSSGAEEPLLKVGDPAPKLQTGKWIQGEPVSDFERDKVYMVEFWATWCGPCRTSIPHVNELHTKFKDKGFVVIGQDVWEQDESKVEPFVKEMGNKMTYRVALDDKNGSEKGKMAETWMTAAGRNGIPSAFIVNKEGKIAWIGHPMTLKEDLLTQVLEGSFDIKKAAADYARQKSTELAQAPLWKKYQTATAAKKWDDAEAAIAELDKVTPAEEKISLVYPRFNLAMAKNDSAAAYKASREALQAPKVHPMMLNEIAWRIVTSKTLENPDLDLAEKLALRANKETDGKSGEVLDTLARVHAKKGDFKSAVTIQEKAAAAVSGSRKEQFEKILETYRAGKLPN